MKFAVLFSILLRLPGWAKWSVTTYNVRNFDDDFEVGKTDLDELAKILKDAKSDVFVFQEIVNKKAFEDLIKTNLTGFSYKISSCGGFGKQSLAVVYNSKTFDYVNQLEDLGFSGNATGCGSLRPLFLVELKHRESGENYTFGASHLKAGGNERAFKQRWEQYGKLEALSKKYQSQNLILLGDFNTTGYNIKDQDYEKFESFMTQSQMRTMTESLGCTNYWTGTLGGEEFQSSILDHIIVQDKNVSKVESVRVSAHCAKLDCRPATPSELGKSFQSVSDHCPVQVTFK